MAEYSAEVLNQIMVAHTNCCYQIFLLTRIGVGDEFFQLLPVLRVGDYNRITFATKK